MECFVIIVYGWKPLNIITKRSILDVAAALDLPLVLEKGSALTKITRKSFLSPWNSKLFAQISAKAINKICCCKEHIFHGEKVKLSELGRRRCSRILRITYYRKNDNWNCSFNQICSATKISSQGNKEQIFWRKPLTCSFSSTVIFEKNLCDHFRTLLALYTKDIVAVGSDIFNTDSFIFSAN